MSASVDTPPGDPKGEAKAKVKPSLPPVNKKVFLAAALVALAITVWALISPTNAETVELGTSHLPRVRSTN